MIDTVLLFIAHIMYHDRLGISYFISVPPTSFPQLSSSALSVCLSLSLSIPQTTNAYIS